MEFSFKPLNNSVNPLDSSHPAMIEYQITASLSNDIMEVSKCEVDLADLVTASQEDWNEVTGSLGNANIAYNLPIVSFSSIHIEKDKKSMSFKIENLKINESSQSTGKANITVVFYKKRGPIRKRKLGTISIPVYISHKTPKIEYFRLYPSLIRLQGSLDLSWKCSDIDNYKIQYNNGDDVVTNLPNINKGEVSGNIPNLKSYENFKKNESFHILATLGENMVATENSVRRARIFETSEWQETSLKETITTLTDKDESVSIRQEFSIVNLVTNDNEDRGHQIWALAHKKEDDSEVILWHSYDGLGWIPKKDKHNKKIIIPPDFVDSPALHFNNELYLIGGSTVDIERVSNETRRYNFKTNRWGNKTESKFEIARFGHSCVVFPNEKEEDCIWVIGGCDQAGNGLKDIWCWNGTEWQQNLNIPAEFPSRCFFTTTVNTNVDGKNELWIDGGFDSYMGSPVSDVWKYDGSWKQIKTSHNQKIEPLSLSPETSFTRASAINNVNNHICVIAETFDDNIYNFLEQPETICNTKIYRLQGGSPVSPTGKWGFDRGDNYKLITRSFNGCIWLLAIEYKRRGVVNISKLYYSVQ